MSIKNLKNTLANRFDNLVKIATTRAIPIAKKEAAKVMRSSSSKVMDQTIKGLYAVAVVAVLTKAYFDPVEAIGAVTSMSNAQTVYNINIESLTINT